MAFAASAATVITREAKELTGMVRVNRHGSIVLRTVDESVSETTSESIDDLIVVGQPFFGKKRLLRDDDMPESSSQVCLNQRVWSKLPEELLILIFARLSVKEILRIRSLNKSWRSAITSPRFQHAFADASPVRVGIMTSDFVDGRVFLTQENKEECFRDSPQFCIARRPEAPGWTYVAATADGLVCVIEGETLQRSHLHERIVGIRVFVMNLVTGTHRELPRPCIMNSPPKLVRMKTNVEEGGYTITFIYTKDLKLEEVYAWQAYNSSKNIWSNDDVAHFKGVDVFNIHIDEEYIFYDHVATFDKETKAINVFNLIASANCDPNGHVHNISGELFKLCKRKKQYGIWKRTCSGRWEMVCECPHFEDLWTCLRVINDWVVLILKFPSQSRREYSDGAFSDFAATFVKVFHMPTKSWHTFPEEEYYMTNWGFNDGEMLNMAFIAELKFDAIP